MADFTYTAKREIQGSHTIDLDYTISIILQQVDDEQPTPVLKQHKSLSGNEINVLHRVERYVSVVTDLVPVSGGDPSALDMQEFFYSVAAGETFEYDDGSPVNVKMAGNPTRSRNGLYFTYSFRFRVL